MVLEISKKKYVDNLLEKFSSLCSQIIESRNGFMDYKELVNCGIDLINKIKDPSSEDFFDTKELPENIKNMLCRSFLENNDMIFFIAGELNPSVYDTLIDSYKRLEEKPFINIICGPYIAVEDDLFLKYHDVYNNRLDNWWYAKTKDKWWEAHPVFKEAQENDKIKINITRKRWDAHFFLGTSAKEVYAEKPHDELEDAEGTAFINQEQLVEVGMELWYGIKKYYCYEWSKKEPGETLFKPRYAFNKEKILKEKWDKKYLKP